MYPNVISLGVWDFARMRGQCFCFALLLGQPRPLCGVVQCVPCSGCLTEEVRGGWGLSSEA